MRAQRRAAVGPAPVVAWLAVLAASVTAPGVRAAEGQGPSPIYLEEVEPGLCFDGDALGAEIRRQLPSVDLRLGPSGEVGVGLSVRRRGADLDVQLRRNGPGGTARSDHKTVATAGSECHLLLETVAAIAVRGATPLGFRPLPPPAPPPPPLPITPPPIHRAVLGPVVVTVPAPLPPASLLQVDAAVRLNIPLDPSQIGVGVGGLLTFSFRERGAWLFVAGGIEQPIAYSSATLVATLQRFPILLGGGYDLEVRPLRGSLRFGVGALLDLLSVTDGRSQPIVWLHGGVHATVTYHYRPIRLVDVFLGLDFEQALQGHTYVAPDGSLSFDSPSTWFNPKLGVALNFP